MSLAAFTAYALKKGFIFYRLIIFTFQIRKKSEKNL